MFKDMPHSSAIPDGDAHPTKPTKKLRGTAVARSFESSRGQALLASAKRYTCAASLLLKCLALFAVLMLRVSVLSAAEQNRLTKLTHESTVVHLENGRGTATMILVQASGSSIPEFKVTAAVGGSNMIPEEHISFKWTSLPTSDSAARRTLLTGQISIDTQIYVEQNTEYKGRVIFFWPDAEQPMDFMVADRTTLSFQLTATKLDLTAETGQSDTATIRLRNTGKADIRKLTISSSDMLDGETQRRIALPGEVKEFNSPALGPAQEAEVSFQIPRPAWAGLYTGTLDVIANGSVRQSIPIVLRSRGPVPDPNLYFLPSVLFGLTLLVGFMLSNKLEAWFNLGGLQRAQTLISLQESERALADVADQIARVGEGRPAHLFSHTTIRLRQSRDELRELLGSASEATQEQLLSESQRFAMAAAQARIFLGAVNVALKQWPGVDQQTKLNQVLTDLDRVAPDADPNAYRDSLRAVLLKAAGEDEGGASALAAREGFPRFPSVAALRSKIKRMTTLHRAVVALVVFFSAYMMFYARDFTFGTLLDYLGVFLWTLGLTQTGSQILARAPAQLIRLRNDNQ